MKFVPALVLCALALGCKPRQETAGTALLGTEALLARPPKTVYHFGIYQYLQPYQQRSSGFTSSEWQAIPSVSQSPWGSSRAGFYVSQHPAYNERYSADGLSSPKSGSPWMMTLTLKDACLENERWIDFSARSVLSYCEARTFSPKGYQVPANCNNEATNYLRANNIGIVRDVWWPNKGFWYIYSRDCVEALDASADGFLRAAGEVNEFWKMAPYDNDERRDTGAEAGYRPGEVTFAILVRALTESSLGDQELIAKVAANAKATDIEAIKGPLIAVTEYAKACVATGNAASLKQQLQFFVSKIDQQSLAREGLSFAQHINNLVRIGLPKLTAACKPDPSIATTATATPKAERSLVAMTGYYESSRGSWFKISSGGTIQFKLYSWDEERTVNATFDDEATARFVADRYTYKVQATSDTELTVTSPGTSGSSVYTKKTEPAPKSSRCRGYSGECRNSDEYTFKYTWNHIGQMGGESFQTMRSNSSNYNPSFYQDTYYTVCGYFKTYNGRKTLFLCGEL